MDFGKLSISNIKRQQQQQQSPNFNRSNNMKNNFNKSSITRKQRQEFASSLALLNQRKFLECGLCLQLFVRPRRLPCSHVFCTDCLVNLRNNMTNGGRHHVVVCPECKQQHSQPVEQMQLDYLVNGLVENIKLPLEAVNQSGLDLFQPNLHYIETNNLFDSDENMHGNVQIAGNTITAIEDIASAVARYEMTHVAVGACKLIPKEYIIVYMEMEILHMNGYMISLNIGDNCFTSNGQYCSWDASEYRYRWNPYGKGKFGKGNVVGAGLVFPPETMCDSAEHGEYGNNGAIRPAWMFYTIDGIAGPTIRIKPREPDDLPLLPRVCMSDAGSEVRMNFGERPFMYDVCAHQFPYELQYS